MPETILEVMQDPLAEVGRISPLAYDDPRYRKQYAALTDNVRLWGWNPRTNRIIDNAPVGLLRHPGDNDGLSRRRMIEALLGNADYYMAAMEAAYTQTSPDIAKVRVRFFPIVTRTLAGLIANTIGSVQPIPARIGQVFHMNWTYQTGASAGNRPDIPSQFNDNYSINNTERPSTINRLRFDIGSTAVNAETWKLASEWSWEAQLDLFASHGLRTADIVPDISTQLLSVEIDRKYINFIRNNVGYTVIWDASDSSSSIPWQSKTDENKRAYEQRLKTVALASLEGQMLARKGVKPNWIIVHPETLQYLERIEKFDEDLESLNVPRPGGQVEQAAHVVGTLGQYLVIADPLYPTKNELLVGYKGDNWLKTGSVLCMYIPPLPTEVFMDPAQMSPRQGFMASAALTMVSEGQYFYGVVKITNAS